VTPLNALQHRRGLEAMERDGFGVAVTSVYLMGFYTGAFGATEATRPVGIEGVLLNVWRAGRSAGYADEVAWSPQRRRKAGLSDEPDELRVALDPIRASLPCGSIWHPLPNESPCTTPPTPPTPPSRVEQNVGDFVGSLFG
jgi:hypothetical protein